MKSSPLPPWSEDHLAALSSEALQQATVSRVAEALARCRQVYPELPEPGVWFDLRGASAGQAHLGRGGLRFNPVLLCANRQAFFDDVIPHEMAHWLVFHLHNGPRLKPHGREWQTVMRDLFGLEPRTTHRFDTAAAQPRPHAYRCACQTHYFTPRRHGLAAKGRGYRCRQCGKVLVHVP